MSASSIELNVDGQSDHNLLVDRILMHDWDNVRGDEENWGCFHSGSRWPDLALFLQPR